MRGSHLFAVAFGLVAVGVAIAPPAHAATGWLSGTVLPGPRQDHTATLLPGGKVLVAGGRDADFNIVSSTVTYDPQTRAWSSSGNVSAPRAEHSATLLVSGKVLVTGGSASQPAADLYSPATNAWSSAGTMSTARWSHTATLLNDGRVLVTGGSTGLAYLASAEIYDPATNGWSAAASMAHARSGHTATLLANGKVLVAGGGNTPADSTAELYDPSTNSWSSAGSLGMARSSHAAVRLLDGRVLIVGTYGSDTAEVYNPTTNSWTTTPAMSSIRSQVPAVLLPDGKVLVPGGYGGYGTWALNSAELFDPATNSWSPAGTMAVDRCDHTATLLPDNTVLVVGGSTSYCSTKWAISGVEIYGSLPDPILTTDAASNITSTGFTLNGHVNPNGVATDWRFEVGVNAGTYPLVSASYSAGSGSASLPVSLSYSNAPPATTFHYRVVALRAGNVVAVGGDHSLTTAPGASGAANEPPASPGPVAPSGQGSPTPPVLSAVAGRATTSAPLALRRRSVTVSSRGQALLTIICKRASARCDGVATLSRGGRTLGEAIVDISAGARRTVRIGFSARARRLLARKHRLAARLRVELDSADGTSSVHTFTVTLRRG